MIGINTQFTACYTERIVLSLLLLLTGCLPSAQPNEKEAATEEITEVLQTVPFEFEVDGNKLVGIFDQPVDREPTATVIIVHGYGKTNAVEQNWHYNLRSKFAQRGINTLMWDKPGCGESEGDFDINQPVQSSADEVVAAVHALKKQGVKGSENIGLWGISRAGWIAPLAIQQEPSIAFWISVSGTDDKENARYLLESNWRIEGRSESETEMLVSEWQESFNTVWRQESYQQYLDASQNLRSDDFMAFMGWGGAWTEEDFYAYQRRFASGELTVDKETELMVYVPDFENVLASIDMPVLALFGEKDTNVDWRKTAELYGKTIGKNPAASLTVKTFPNANHILKQGETGGIREMNSQSGDAPYVDRYYETMIDWLVDHKFGS